MDKESDNLRGISLQPDIIKEAPNIAHNGLLLLTLVESSMRLSILENEATSMPPFDELTQGILSMQRHDGAFRTYY